MLALLIMLSQIALFCTMRDVRLVPVILGALLSGWLSDQAGLEHWFTTTDCTVAPLHCVACCTEDTLTNGICVNWTLIG